MSQEEQFASHGKLIAEYASTKNRLIALRAEARRIADAALRLGNFILTARADGYRHGVPNTKSLLPPDKIAELLNQISDEAERLESLAGQLKALGLDIELEVLGPFSKAD